MGGGGCVAWTWLDQEKKIAVFFARIEPKPETVRWPGQTWNPVEVLAAETWLRISDTQLHALLASLYRDILAEFNRLGIPLLETMTGVEDFPKANRSQGGTCLFAPVFFFFFSLCIITLYRHWTLQRSSLGWRQCPAIKIICRRNLPHLQRYRMQTRGSDMPKRRRASADGGRRSIQSSGSR
jgi:hypothetical protein